MAEVAQYVSPIADPLIKPEGKLHQKVLKLLKKAHGSKAVRRGVPEITKLLRKGKKGVVVLAADIFPVELIAHMKWNHIVNRHAVFWLFSRNVQFAQF